jgi:hypothetical protein
MFIFLKPQDTSSRERWKSDCRQAKIICSNPLPPQGTSSGGRWKKTIFGRQKSLLQHLPFPRHQHQGVAFPSTNFADTSKRMTFSKQKPPFQILAPSNTSSGRTSSRRFFGSEIHFPNQTSSPIIDFFKPKANKSGHMLGLYVNLIVFLPYRFA